MSRYIDANKLKKSLSIPCASIIEIGETIIAQIDDQPTADVVEVVRCKDCKYRDTMPEYEYDDDHEHRTLMGTDFCRWWHDESPNDDDYCSYGERKEG